jgi:hypothetical protein
MRSCLGLILLGVALECLSRTKADEPTPRRHSERRERAIEFHVRSQQRTGVLVPMYVYPASIHTNASYNRLIELKRRFETVP